MSPPSALLITCPICNASEGQPCNTPTDTGRRDVRWFHRLRENRAGTRQTSETD